MRTSEIPADKSKDLGAVFTPATVAIWLASMARRYGANPEISIDPAAGEGALLEAARAVFPNSRLSGADIDPESQATLFSKGFAEDRLPVNGLRESSFPIWQQGEALVIANPPWGAKFTVNERLEYRQQFTCATGQFDSFGLFTELIINSMRVGDYAAILLPDTVLLPEHARIREFVHKTCEVFHVARLPEGVFEGVNMGCVALILRRGDTLHDVIDFSRIPREQFPRLASNPDDLIANTQLTEFRVESKLVQRNNFGWNIVAYRSGLKFELSKLMQDPSTHSTWDQWFRSGRGIEIGRKSADLLTQQTVGKGDQFMPVAVGGDVHRRCVSPSRWIDTSRTKLDLKSEFETRERLLVRKTGIGIKASVVRGVATTQTVYNFVQKDDAPPWATHYAAGLLTSRVVIALHLAHAGDVEWRSHPYVTQRIVRTLPLPIPQAGSSLELTAKKIADVSRRLHRSKKTNPALEKELDALVAAMLGQDMDLVDWAFWFLSQVTNSGYVASLVDEEFAA